MKKTIIASLLACLSATSGLAQTTAADATQLAVQYDACNGRPVISAAYTAAGPIEVVCGEKTVLVEKPKGNFNIGAMAGLLLGAALLAGLAGGGSTSSTN